MATHETFTDNPGLAFLLGSPRPGFAGNWVGSVSIWGGLINNTSVAGNLVVDVSISNVPSIPLVQAEVFGEKTYINGRISGVNVTKIEWSLPNSADVLARYTFDAPIPFPISVSQFVGIFQFVDLLANGLTQQSLFDDYLQSGDTLIGGGATDIMRGGGGNDALDGGGGADELAGDSGDDSFVYRVGDAVAGEVIDGGIGADRVYMYGGAATGDLLGAGHIDISNLNISSVEEIFTNGTEVAITAAQLNPGGFTTFEGTTGKLDAVTIANVNNANLSGLAFINWEAQDRVGIIGTAGVDTVTGTIQSDVFAGLGGTDSFYGGGGNDRFLILEGDMAPADGFYGGSGTDILQVDGVSFTQFGVGQKTSLRGMPLDSVETLEVVKGQIVIGADMLSGTITGTAAAPVLLTGRIDRVIGNGTDAAPNNTSIEIIGGTALAIDLSATVFETWNDGFYVDKSIRIFAGAQTQQITGAANEENFIVGTAAAAGIFVTGGSQDDLVYGSYKDDYIVGGGGYDYIVGLAGNDLIGGEDGDDIIYGGEGNDTVGGGAGIDNLYGGGGNDKLQGLTGADVMFGGLGDDTFYIDTAGDVVSEAAGTGTGYDTEVSTISRSISANIERLALTGTTNINATGNADSNTLLGNSGMNVLNGGAGIDGMAGGDGHDTYIADVFNDVVQETNAVATTGGNDIVYFNGTVGTFTLGANVERLTLNGSSAINGTGNAFINIIVGNGGSNIINGRFGNDTLTGGGGNDFFVFNSTPNTASNRDTITDFNVIDDTIRLDHLTYTALGVGALTAGAFNTGMAATQADDRIVYNTATGALLYDADGLGGVAGIQFATLTGLPAITAADFILV
jgi:Ca2+-binding RTX toxin-like protein